MHAFLDTAERHGVPLCAFLGDTCATTWASPELDELHWRYHEPRAAVLPSAEAIARGHAVHKLLFMTEPEIVDTKLKPDWEVGMRGCPEAGPVTV